MFSSTRYLGWTLVMIDNYWPEIFSNLRKARKAWDRLYWILGREEVYVRTLGQLYLAIVQATVIFGLEMWFVESCIASTLWGFHHQVSRQITGKLPCI